MARLTYKKRKALPAGVFVFKKERRYPIHDINHARSALSMVARFGDEKEKKKVRAAVYRRYPELKIRKIQRDGIRKKSRKGKKVRK
tara:strand:- start:1615 stop:1872 length:258 start_codon:yes stop_codon:yes gene_type:complete